MPSASPNLQVRFCWENSVFPCPPFQEAKSRTGKIEGSDELEG
ncbi:hypothetical protein SLEP1_g28694 [Rubroshorea leprosula]|uniref:Uncharacterized protein n=1 Tax=Rubroshorea leprosula TaxID=152421 RepID=A0AAV5K3Y6_9ROSI|nr:hypothetical protein SLEP1_g28694 [Rubroshorea leprosula]